MPKANHFATYGYHGPSTNNQNRQTEIDDETALWAARMIIGEGGQKCPPNKASACLWALMNRWMLHPGRRYWPTLLYLMRRFSQPINPRWQKGGDLARKYAGTWHCTPARIRRRAWVSSRTLEQIPIPILERVRAFQTGTLPPPQEVLNLDKSRISNWASLKGLPEKYPWGIQLTRAKQPDWFFEERNLIHGTVVIDHWK